MKPHLTEDMLIQYQFDLLTEEQANEARSHLDECSTCRQQMERLSAKFSALDLLADDADISDELIGRTIANSKKSKPIGKRLLISTPQWFSAAAAILIVGLLAATVYVNRGSWRNERQSLGTAKDIKEDTIEVEGLSEKSGVRKMLDSPAPVVSFGSDPDTAHRAAKPMKEAIDEKPPFAPASAIELVTLPRREDLQLTIYNSADLTLVREKRNLTMKQGWNWLQFMWANTQIDPTSLSITPLKHADKIDVQQLVYPARLKDIGRWLIRSEITGQVPFEITYMTSGISWRAFYMGTLAQDEKTMSLAGYVRVNNNSGEDYEDAQTRLIVGKVNQLDRIADLAKRQYPYGNPIPLSKGDTSKLIRNKVADLKAEYEDYDGDNTLLLGDMPMNEALFQSARFELTLKEITKEGLSEYFLYTIEGTETIPDKWGKRLPSFDIDDIPVESLYKYDEDRYGSNTVCFLSFANDEEHEMGDTPLPDGMVKIFRQTNADSNLSYVGGTSTKYIPVDEDVELNLGIARLVNVEPKLMNSKTENYTFDRDGNINGYDEIQTWQIEVTNSRKLPVEIEITRNFNTAYWTIEAIDYEKLDLTRIRFERELEPQTSKTIGYTVTIYHGKREDVIK